MIKKMSEVSSEVCKDTLPIYNETNTVISANSVALITLIK